MNYHFEKISPVALPSFQSRVHSVHTTLKTPRKKMSANPSACILYNKKYNMRHPIFASIILLLPAHAQDNAVGFVGKLKTQFLPKSKPPDFDGLFQNFLNLLLIISGLSAKIFEIAL